MKHTYFLAGKTLANNYSTLIDIETDIITKKDILVLVKLMFEEFDEGIPEGFIFTCISKLT